MKRARKWILPGRTILDLGDDMVTEILLRLPPESIFKYRSVSREWNSLLSSPEFLSHYSRRFRQRTLSPPHNLLGFFIFFPVAPRMPFFSIGGENFSSDLGYFIASSNGLVLCGGDTDPNSYHILNPMTRKHVSLPPPRKYHTDCIVLPIGLSCDEDSDDLTPRYEVVIAHVPRMVFDNKLCIETYSSETKEWRESVLVATSDFRLIIVCPPKVVNGVFYWRAVPLHLLAVYDPHNKLGGNRDGNQLQLIQLPDPAKQVLNQTPDGRLIFGGISNGLIKIWELSARKLRETTIAEQEWVLIHEVPIGLELMDELEGLRLVEVITWNPLVLMVGQGSSVFQYNMETKQMQHIASLPDKKPLDEPFFKAISFSSYLLA